MRLRYLFVGSSLLLPFVALSCSGDDSSPVSAADASPDTTSGGDALAPPPDGSSDTATDTASDAAGDADAAAASGPVLLAGGDTTCMFVTGTLKCWGGNTNGGLGLGTNDFLAHPAAAPVPGVSSAAQVGSVGPYHVCLASGAQTYCWGFNGLAQVGHSPLVDDDAGDAGSCGVAQECVKAPVLVPGVTTAVALRLGQFHSCGVLADHTVSCWGDNSQGALGFASADGGPLCHTFHCEPATPTPGLTGVAEIAASVQTTCVRLAADGTIHCFGSNAYAELGQSATASGDTLPHPTPVMVTGVSGSTALALGGNHGCAILADKTVTCWGQNHFGQLGHSPTLDPGACFDCNSTATVVPGLTNVREISLGFSYSCAVKTDDTVTCWGSNLRGQLGHDPATDDGGGGIFTWDPTPVAGLTQVAHIATGWNHACALKKDNTVYCWGQNTSGQLGSTLAASATSTFVPTLVP